MSEAFEPLAYLVSLLQNLSKAMLLEMQYPVLFSRRPLFQAAPEPMQCSAALKASVADLPVSSALAKAMYSRLPTPRSAVQKVVVYAGAAGENLPTVHATCSKKFELSCQAKFAT